MPAKDEIPAYLSFLQEAQAQLAALVDKNSEELGKAARKIAPRLKSGGRLLGFGCGHSGLISQDAYYRAGGLKGYIHIFAPRVELDQHPVAHSSVEEKTPGWIEGHLQALSFTDLDCLIVISTSGVNAVPVEAALCAKKAGVLVVAITSVAASSELSPRHESGMKLSELGDFVLDNQSPYGDSLVAVTPNGSKMGSASTAAGCLLVQSLSIAVQEESLRLGAPLPTYVSGNLPGGMEKNASNQ